MKAINPRDLGTGPQIGEADYKFFYIKQRRQQLHPLVMQGLIAFPIDAIDKGVPDPFDGQGKAAPYTTVRWCSKTGRCNPLNGYEMVIEDRL